MQRQKRSWKVPIGATMTFAWFLFVVWVVKSSAGCDYSKIQNPGLLDVYFSCRTLNEIGDFLAGVFAPAAFLWLVLAVIIQSSELREQRDELRLTRLEFEQNRAVMNAQVQESQKQAEFIGLQTAIMRRQEEGALKADADKELLHKAKLLRLWVNRVWQRDEGGFISSDDLLPTDPFDLLAELSTRLLRAEMTSDHWFELSLPGEDMVAMLIKKLREIESVAERCSPSTIQGVASTQLSRVLARIEKRLEQENSDG